MGSDVSRLGLAYLVAVTVQAQCTFIMRKFDNSMLNISNDSEKVIGWYNVYPIGTPQDYVYTRLYRSEQSARDHAAPSCIGQKSVIIKPE